MGFDFRSYIKYLEKNNALVRIKREVDPKFELPAILWKFQPQGKAVFFENVKGSKQPVAGGLLQGMERVRVSLGITPTKGSIQLDDTEFLDAAVAHPLVHERVVGGPVKEVVKRGKDVDLTELPVPTFFEHDSGPFITGGVGITRNPETDILNAGIYRIFVMGKDTITVNAADLSDLSLIYKAAEEKGEELSIAVAIGVDPALLVGAVAKSPGTISELDVAGALNGEPLKVVECETCDLWVPANAEIVIEGKVDFSNKVANNLGEIAGYYGSSINPVTRITAITYRHDAIFYVILAGPTVEHITLGSLVFNKRKKSIINGLMREFPIIREANAVAIGTSLHLILSIEKKNDEEPMKLIREIFQTTIGPVPISQFAKRIVVVDDDVDVFDQNDVEWAIWSRVADAAKILILPDMVSSKMDLAAKAGKSVRVGIDATKDLGDAEKLKKAVIPGFDKIRIKDYLED